MLGSNNDNVKLTAVKSANKLLTEAKTTWREVLEATPATTSLQRSKSLYTFADYASMLLDNYEEAFTDWEISFLESWTTRRYAPTEKQLIVFHRLSRKTGEELPDAW